MSRDEAISRATRYGALRGALVGGGIGALLGGAAGPGGAAAGGAVGAVLGAGPGAFFAGAHAARGGGSSSARSGAASAGPRHNEHYSGHKSFSTMGDYVRNAPTAGQFVARAVTVVPRTMLHDVTLIPQRVMVARSASVHANAAQHATNSAERAFHQDMARQLSGGTGFAMSRQASFRNFGGGPLGMARQISYQRHLAAERHGLIGAMHPSIAPAHIRANAMQHAIKNAQFEAKHHRVHGRFR